jgi:hypothetical protein
MRPACGAVLRRLERAGRTGLRGLRAVVAAAGLRARPTLRPAARRLEQLGHAWGPVGRIPGQPHRAADRWHRRQPRSVPTRSPWCTGRHKPWPTCWAWGDPDARGGAHRRWLLAAEVRGCAHGRGGAMAGALREPAARPGVHPQDHGWPDRTGAPELRQAVRTRAVPTHRRPAVAVCLRATVLGEGELAPRSSRWHPGAVRARAGPATRHRWGGRCPSPAGGAA